MRLHNRIYVIIIDGKAHVGTSAPELSKLTGIEPYYIRLYAKESEKTGFIAHNHEKNYGVFVTTKMVKAARRGHDFKKK
jgi:hypothetical protein